MKEKNEFLTSSIEDIQLTIRAIDVKIGAALVLVLAPFASVGRIFGHVDRLAGLHSWPATIICILFFLLWLLALLSLIRGLAALDNPAIHIVNHGTFSGSYYAGGLYSFGFIDLLLNRKLIQAKRDVPSVVASLPHSEPTITTALVFEQMKLAYIRDIKVHRLNWGIFLAGIWLSIGILIYLLSRYGHAM